jgi:hypothetical protein
LITICITAIVDVSSNTVLVYSFRLLLLLLFQVNGISRVFQLFVNAVVVELGSCVITQSLRTEIEVGFTKVRGISTCILTFGVLVNSVGLCR